jgi:hypothetical protein
MRIAEVAPLAESVPPKLYGGTERVVSWLTEELVGLGCNVTLFTVVLSERELAKVPRRGYVGALRPTTTHAPRWSPPSISDVLIEGV